MFKWYVKARNQKDHYERCAELGCDVVLEDTSPQVDPATPLPHVIVQYHVQKQRGPDAELEPVDVVFLEPVDRREIDRLSDAVLDRLKDVETL